VRRKLEKRPHARTQALAPAVLGVGLLAWLPAWAGPLPQAPLARAAEMEREVSQRPGPWVPPPGLETHRAQWRQRLAEVMAADPGNGPVRTAWLLGAWWAILDGCQGAGRPCVEEAADYVKTVLGTDPRGLDTCDWEHGGLPGITMDAWALTTGLLQGREVPSPQVSELLDRHDDYGAECRR
jgi:hypothetical protein